MYRLLDNKELKLFVNKYFKSWSNDIEKVSIISYNEIEEYLINDHYLFIIK